MQCAKGGRRGRIGTVAKKFAKNLGASIKVQGKLADICLRFSAPEILASLGNAIERPPRRLVDRSETKVSGESAAKLVG